MPWGMHDRVPFVKEKNDVALCLLVAEAFHFLVERPATMLSRRLGR